MTASRGKSAHQAHFAPRRACAVFLQSRIVSGSTDDTSGNAGLPLVHMATGFDFFYSEDQLGRCCLVVLVDCLRTIMSRARFLYSAGERRLAQLWRNDICSTVHDYLNAIRGLAGAVPFPGEMRAQAASWSS